MQGCHMCWQEQQGSVCWGTRAQWDHGQSPPGMGFCVPHRKFWVHPVNSRQWPGALESLSVGLCCHDYLWSYGSLWFFRESNVRIAIQCLVLRRRKFYSYVHTMFGSFLHTYPTPSFVPHPFHYPPSPLLQCSNYFAPISNFVEERV
jgi:hypothetical protein